jgi:urease accessory protein UreF
MVLVLELSLIFVQIVLDRPAIAYGWAAAASWLSASVSSVRMSAWRLAQLGQLARVGLFVALQRPWCGWTAERLLRNRAPLIRRTHRRNEVSLSPTPQNGR